MNRSAREKFRLVRRELDRWFSRYPETGQPELQIRFRSKIDLHHQAALFELLLHELLLRLDCELTLHPPLSHTKRTPDFLVKDSDGRQFYIEATVATGELEAEAAAQSRVNAVYDALDRLVQSPNFFLWLRGKRHTKIIPPVRRIASDLNRELSKLDPDEITALQKSGRDQEIPEWSFDYDDWSILIITNPKKS